MSTLLAQATQPGADHVMLTVAGVLAAAIAVPFVLAVATSFLKLVVVGHILRSALGTPGVPPTIVITGLAVVLSVHIMTPTAQRAYAAVQQAQAAAAPPTMVLKASRGMRSARLSGAPGTASATTLFGTKPR